MKNNSRVSYKLVEKIAKDRGIKLSEIYKYLDISRQTFHQFKTVNIPLNHLERLSDFFNIDRAILLLGNEDSNINNDGDINIKAHEQKEDISDDDKACTYLSLSRAFFSKDIRTEGLRALKIKRDDMVPDLSPNDWLIYEKKVGTFKGDGVYVLRFGGNYIVRKITHNEITNEFCLSTYNTKKEDIISFEELHDHLLGKRIAQLQF